MSDWETIGKSSSNEDDGWETISSKDNDSFASKIGRSIAGGVGAGIDFVAPANLAVPGLIEGTRTLINQLPFGIGEHLGGISSEQAAQNITSGNIPGTSIPYSELQPTKLLENFTGKGSIQNKEYEQANKPLHALTEAATNLGAWSTEKTGSPLVGTITNLGAATLAMAGAHKGAVKTLEKFQKPPTVDPKIEAAKKEYEEAKSKEAPVNNFAARKEGFIFNPQTKRMERGSEYIDPLTNQIVDSRKGTQGTTEPRVDERFQEPTQVPEERRLGLQAGEPLVTFPDGTTMTRAEWEQRGKPESKLPTEEDFSKILEEEQQKQQLGQEIDTSGVRNPYFQGDRTANVEVDSVNGRPMYPDKTKVETPIISERTGERINGNSNPINGTRIDPDRISRHWRDLTDAQKKEMGVETAQEYQDFVELHELSHTSDRNKGKTYPSRLEAEKATNRNAFNKQQEMKSNTSRTLEDIERENEAMQKESESPTKDDGSFSERQAQLDLEDASTDPSITRKDWQIQRARNKQRGSVNFGFSEFVVDKAKELFSKGMSYTEFVKQLGTDLNDPTAKQLYEKYYGKSVKDLPTEEQAAVSKIPGLREVVSPELKSVDEMLPRWEVEPDVSSSFKSLRENLSSGGRTTAMRTGDSFIDWNVENILGTTKRAQVIIKEAQQEIKGEVKKLTGGLLDKLKGNGSGERIFVEAMSSLLKSEGNNTMPNISREAKLLVDTMRKHLDDLGLKIQEELRSQGVENFQWRPNYLAGVFFGPYRSIVKDSQGKTIGVIAGRTKSEATAAIDYIKETMPDVSFDVPEYNPKFDIGGTSLGARYGKASEVLELLRNQDEAAQTLQTHLSDYYAKAQDNYMGYKQHFKEKKGVFGSEGNRPWENAKNNAYDLLEAQLGIIDHGYHWLAEQKIAKDMDSILTNQAISEGKRNSINYVNMYLDHAFGRMKDEMAFVDTGIQKASEVLGIAPSATKEMLAITRNAALTGTLGLSGAFGLTQFIQVPTTLAIAFSKAKDMGISGNKAGSTLVGTMDLIHGLTGKIENMSAEGRYFYDYFKKAGELDPALVEHTIHRKIIGTTGMNPIQKAIAEAINGTFKGAEVISNLIGKVSIEKPEAWTRGTFAMTMAHFYKSAGYSMKEAAIQASKDTSSLFVDYSSQERAMIFQRMGEAGKFASTVSTFKLNNLNQWLTFSNKKMYGALAALALTSWFTTGLAGLPMGDEAEFLASWAKSKGMDIDTPREFMLKNLPDAVSFGPLSQALTPFGGPSMALHRKFAQDNVIPDDLASFLYPLLSFYTNKISKGVDWIKSGEFSGQEGKAFLREMAPGNLKYLVDAKALTNDKGLTLDTNTMHDREPTYVERSKADRILGVTMGIPSQNEWKSKQIKQLDRISEQAWKESTKSKVTATISAFDNGNEEKFNRLYREALTYSPESASQIKSYIEGHAKSRNMNLDQALQLKFAKGAKTTHGAKLLQNFQRMNANR